MLNGCGGSTLVWAGSYCKQNAPEYASHPVDKWVQVGPTSWFCMIVRQPCNNDSTWIVAPPSL